jgi:primosomal replication protein N
MKNTTFQEASIRQSNLLFHMQQTGYSPSGIPHMRYLIAGYGTGNGNGGWHRVAPSVPIKCLYRAMERAFACRRAALGGSVLADVEEPLTTFMNHR